MRKLIILILVIISLGIFVWFNKVIPKGLELIHTSPAREKPDRIGEVLTYNVQLGGLNLGTAVFRRLPDTVLNNKKVSLMTFETRLARFTDLERIYSDPVTFLPLRIERTISLWRSPEKIIEDYDQEKFVLTIKKIKGKKTEELVIKKANVINNAILLPFFIRDRDDLAVGYELGVSLPKQDFLVKIAKKEEINVPLGKFSAYHFQSTPKNFEIWIAADEHRLPLKIKGTTNFGYTLVLKSYKN